MSNTKITGIESLGTLRATVNTREINLKSKDPNSDETFTLLVRDLFYNDWIELGDIIKRQSDLLEKVSFKTKLKATEANKEKIIKAQTDAVTKYAQEHPEFQTEMLEISLHLFSKTVVNEDGSDFGNSRELISWIRQNVDLNDLADNQDEIVNLSISPKDVELVEKN
jgi:hypothetical protein